jgi:hypothetical protein
MIQVSGMSLKSLFAGAAPVVCAGIFIPQLAVAAVTVEVNDGAGETLCSGDLVNMSTTTGKVTVGMDGNCGAGVGTLGNSAVNMGDVDEGDYSALTTTILNGVTFTPPVSFQVADSGLGVKPTVTAKSDLTYLVSYSAANVAVDQDTNDSFLVTISDSADPAQSATLRFDVRVKDVAAPPPPPPGSGCIDSTTIICKGDLDLTTNGERYYVPIDFNTTQVWTIASDMRASFEKFSFRYLTNVMTVSISESFNADSQGEYCTLQVASGSLYFNETATYGQCHINPDTTYFLRITSPKSGSYSFFY